MERQLKDERVRSIHLRSQVKLLEIDLGDLREEKEALQHKLGTIKTQSMVKDGQIEQLEVSLDESKIECQRLNVCCTQRESDVVTAENSKADALELCMLHEQHAERVTTELQALEQDAAVERHRSVLMVRELEEVRSDAEASRSVCEKLGLDCRLKASDECQTYGTLQLACCGSFICEPCVQAWNEGLAGDEQAPAAGTLMLLRCFW
ncbi:g9118 [Coccomyxa viridis]|uniref:G9118 protein n=1 Tax=Coccomyxa viridis TaxID=1274662 RepID=A0ABP1G8U9_9CHLO